MPRRQKTNGKTVKNVTKNESTSFMCSSCCYSSKRSSNLKRHVLKLHSTLGKKLECCKIQFATKSELQKHARTVHETGYKCKFNGCDKMFPKKATLDRHYDCHNKKKNFLCSKCDYGSPFSYNMMRHCKNSGHGSPQLALRKQVRRRSKNFKETSAATSSETTSSQDNCVSNPTLHVDVLVSAKAPKEPTMRKPKHDWSQMHSDEESHAIKEDDEASPSQLVCNQDNAGALDLSIPRTNQKSDEESQAERLEAAHALLLLSMSRPPVTRVNPQNQISPNMFNSQPTAQSLFVFAT